MRGCDFARRARSFPAPSNDRASRTSLTVDERLDAFYQRSNGQRWSIEHLRRDDHAEPFLAFEQDLDQRDLVQAQAAAAERHIGPQLHTRIARAQDGVNLTQHFVRCHGASLLSDRLARHPVLLDTRIFSSREDSTIVVLGKPVPI